ncbi:GNAT family N-acetyltransferase [Cyanobium sp. Cruz CV13-4-11]|nr:GNAT family N-acetyltransferase [Cyanobium sp. Cruz CV11-17]MCP9919194.1 GNAT family N-acetyltransferase [Cyanobium sp. Cruz CV13-4-11]
MVALLIGFVSKTYPDQAYVHGLDVHPARRGEGVGWLLYGHFFGTAASLGCRTVHGVTAPANRDSVAFHHRMGFLLLESDFKIDGVPVAVGDDGKGGNRVIVTKNLDTPDIVR